LKFNKNSNWAVKGINGARMVTPVLLGLKKGRKLQNISQETHQVIAK
jgi:hypothetical protein